MKFLNRKPEITRLDEPIEELLEELKGFEGNDPDFKLTTERLQELYDLRDKELKTRVSPDTVLLVGGNVVIASLVLWFERTSVVTTKLSSFLSKLR